MEDFDLEKFVDLFDTAMTSDNPTIKKAFKNLMIVATLVTAENETKTGPLKQLLKTVDDLKSRVAVLESSKQYSYAYPQWNNTYPTVSTIGVPSTHTTGYASAGGGNMTYTIDTSTLDQIYGNLGTK